jgi:S-adenosylmethionine synthetase
MKLIIDHACTDPDRLPFDAAERKGIGHPDSLADLVADTFSRSYATWSRREFGSVANHWVDKVNLVGAAADVRFGGFDIHKPIDAYLFGKITDRVGDRTVPVEEIFRQVITEVLPAALNDASVLDHVRMHVNNTSGVAVDHDPAFYRPESSGDLTRVLSREAVANDTVICVGTSRRGLAADLAIRLERLIACGELGSLRPMIGTDVKVMVVRQGTLIDVTAAVPFHPGTVDSWRTYKTALAEVQTEVGAALKTLLDQDPRGHGITDVTLHLNTKDSAGRGYLAPFGTSLGKGDCGAVGRGNRYNGAIEPLRPSSCEAPAGKNPVHHAGKIYTAVCAESARRVLEETSVYAEVTIAARNGAALTEPAYVLVSVDHRPDGKTAEAIERIVRHSISEAPQYVERFLASDPLTRFRDETP